MDKIEVKKLIAEAIELVHQLGDESDLSWEEYKALVIETLKEWAEKND